MKRSILLLCGTGALSLMSGCPLPVSNYEIELGPDQVLAADVKGGQFDYWILDASGAIVDDGELVVSGAGSVTVHADQSAGIYLTTPSYSSAPAYSVKFDGSVRSDAVFSYLDTDEAGFADIRTGQPATMFAKHGAMLEVATQIRANWTLDSALQSDALTTLAHDQVTGQQSDLQAGITTVVDSGDLDAASSGSASIAGWAVDAQTEMNQIEPQALADTSTAQSEATTYETAAPDPTALQSAVEDCIDLEGWGDEIEGNVDKFYPDKEGDTYDGKKDGGELERSWVTTEANLETMLTEQDATADEVEDCVEEAIGEEPVVTVTETSEDPYVVIGDAATASAEGAATDADAWLATVESDWSADLDGDEVSAWGMTGWMAPADAASALLEAEIGSEMFAESTGGAVSYASDSVTARSDSSFTACEDTTPVFQIELAGLGFVVGTPFDDVIRGADDASSFEVMWGGKGDDCMNGLKGHEIILGGPGNDELHGGDQHELIVGGSGDDAIFAGYGEDYTFSIGAVSVAVELGSVLFGGSGDDFLSGGDPDYDENDADEYGYTDLIFGDGLTSSTAGNDEIDGGGGIDLLFGQWDDDTIRNRRPGRIEIDSIAIEFGSFHFGGKGDDVMTGSDSFDLMVGGTNDDTIESMAGIDLILGGSGDDEVDGGEGLDLVFGGSGDDTANGNEGIDLVMGNSGDDVVLGGDGALDLLFGGAGDDAVSGEGGFDVAFGNSGRDFVNGNDDMDLLFGNGDNDSLAGGDGIDLIFGNGGRDRVEGNDGAVDLLFGNDETDIVIGGPGLDVSFGNDDDDWMDGEDGVDLSFGGEGDDVMFGGTELDLLFANAGDDCVWGEDGVDLAFGGDDDDQVSGGEGFDLLFGSAGADLLHGDGGVDLLFGGDDADQLDGGDSLGMLFGNEGDDVIQGGDTLDLSFGGDGADCANGGSGFDIAFGGKDGDTLLDQGVAFGQDSEDQIQTSAIGFGGDGNDVVAQVGTSYAFLMGAEGDDDVTVDPSGDIAFAFGGKGADVLSATGATSASSSATTRAFLFGGDDGDWMQVSRGKSFAFGRGGDDTMSADADGTATNDDQKDKHFGGSDDDAMYGDNDNKQDKLYRGSGDDPTRVWDSWPSTSPSWSVAHATPSFTACPTVPDADSCERQMEPPGDVGAK